jgi:8-oxo-dGTP diphosphatase
VVAKVIAAKGVEVEVSQRTLVFLVERKEQRVLLGYKKAGFGKGRLLGIGGKVEVGESIADAAIREVKEEVNVTIAQDQLHDCGMVKFRFPTKPKWNQDVAIFKSENWLGSPVESEEIQPQWVSISEIPFERMWDDAKYWLPKLLNNSEVDVTVIFNDDLETVKSVDWLS